MDKILICVESFHVVDTPEDADVEFDPVVWETKEEHEVNSIIEALNEALEFMKDHPNYVLSREFCCSGGGFEIQFSRDPDDYKYYERYWQFCACTIDE